MDTQTETTSVYKVKQGTFEGPLELLVSLIESRKLFVNDISISLVTDEYIAYVRELSHSEERKLSDISSFILTCATLILIKSRSLLPNIELTVDEEEKIVDLESRLKLYSIIKNASITINNEFGSKVIFAPRDRIWSNIVFTPEASISVSSMKESIDKVLLNIPKIKEELPKVEIKKVISIDEMIESLHNRIQNAINVSFRDFAKSNNPQDDMEYRVHTIVSFLAMLELVKEGIIDVIQNNNFEEIQMNKQTILEAK